MSNIYLLVFGSIAVILVLAVVSVFIFNVAPQSSNSLSLTNLTDYGPAPAIQGISAWINSPPINMSQLKGKVVIVDFWTYSCINCIRTIPFLNALQSEYGKNGLVIIGVSTPEFQFEHNLTNVENAVKRFNITYAVALDNNYTTWTAYNNHYWPADYIIDKNGTIRYESFGESPGDFNQTQQVVRELLQSAGYTLPNSTLNVKDILNFTQQTSPEMYLGYQELATGRTNYFGNSGGLHQNTTYNYTITNISQADTIYLQGQWYSAPDSIIAENGSKLILVYRAKYVNVVASGTNSLIEIEINGTNVSKSYLGADDKLVNGVALANVSTPRLYSIVAAPSYGIHILEINASPGFRLYTFTFG